MTTQGLTARTTVRDLGRFVLAERKGLQPPVGIATTSRNKLERSGSGEREPRFTNGAVCA